MGSTDMNAANKAVAKEASAPGGQDQSMPAGYPDWTAAFQAYYGQTAQPPAGYYPATSAPQAHPYMWGQMMPYGQASPYGAPMYPPVYGAHPGAQAYMGYGMPASSVPGGMDPSAEGQKDGAAAAGAAGGAAAADAGGAAANAGAQGKGATSAGGPSEGSNKLAVGNGVFSASGGDDDDDEDDDDEDDIEPGKQSHGLSMAMGVDYWASAAQMQQQAGGAGGQPGGTGMLMSPSAPGGTGGKKRSSSAANGAGGGMGGSTDMWLHQDDRDVKRQRRKQSNRESARRSRLRKQAECEELATRVHSLAEENITLRSEMMRLQEECSNTVAHSTVLQERLKGAGVPASELPPLPSYAPQGPPDMPGTVTTALAVSVPAVPGRVDVSAPPPPPAPVLALVPAGSTRGQGGEVSAQQVGAGTGTLVSEAAADQANASTQGIVQAGQQLDGLQGVVGGGAAGGEAEGGPAGGSAGQPAQGFGQVGESGWGESGSCEPRDLNNSHPFESSLMGSNPSTT